MEPDRGIFTQTQKKGALFPRGKKRALSSFMQNLSRLPDQLLAINAVVTAGAALT